MLGGRKSVLKCTITGRSASQYQFMDFTCSLLPICNGNPLLKRNFLFYNENRAFWKLGTLPPGLITFYPTTKPLGKSWRVLGLGYNPSISMDEINNAAVVHFNGNMKPCLDIGMVQYRPLWTKYVDYPNEYIQSCSFAP